MFKRILVAMDGSEAAERALRAAGALARQFDAELSAVHVPQMVGDVLMAGDLPMPYPVAEREYAEACERMNKRVADLAEEGGHAAPEIIFRAGDPAREILALAKERNADLIVMGRRGLGNFSGMLVGSVTHKVEAGAECAVLTMR